MTEILVPPLGESVSSATVARWLKKAGEAVTADEPLVELETDKVTVEVNAPSAGVIEAIAADEGAEVGPGAVLGTIAAGAAAAAVAPPPPAPVKAAPPVEAPRAPSGPVSRPGEAQAGAALPSGPAATKAMAEAGVTAEAVPPEAAAELARNVEMARALEASGTPTFVVGDQVLQGAVGYEALKQAIAEVRRSRT